MYLPSLGVWINIRGIHFHWEVFPFSLGSSSKSKNLLSAESRFFPQEYSFENVCTDCMLITVYSVSKENNLGPGSKISYRARFLCLQKQLPHTKVCPYT